MMRWRYVPQTPLGQATRVVLIGIAILSVWGRLPSTRGQSPMPAAMRAPYMHPEFEFQPVSDALERRPPIEGPYLNLDRYYEDHPHEAPYDSVAWQIDWLPEGTIYKPYLAGPKESRLSAVFQHERELKWLWDATLGARAGIFRYGTGNIYRPEGFQMDVEASAQVRLDLENNMDLTSADYRVGFPLAYGTGRHQWKLAYYHMSSHLGDEFLLRNPGYPRVNWARDAVVLGYAVYLGESVRLYGEVGYAVASKVSKEWEVQFGVESAPLFATGVRGAPFWAVNVHLREEIDFDGNLVAELGWAWRSDQNAHLYRTGLYYMTGKSNQFSFFDVNEHQLGLGFWLDL